MQKLLVLVGRYRGLKGEGYKVPGRDMFHVFFPSVSRPQHNDYVSGRVIKPLSPPKPLRPPKKKTPPILGSYKYTKLREGMEYQVHLMGYKCSCGSVWCRNCYVKKGGSERFASRLNEMDFRAVRQVVLTIDLKKFDGSGQRAFEHCQDKKAVAQFIHNLRRTGKIIIKDWAWVLEWHSDGAPHWHVFIETERGKKGQIGNHTLLRHWSYGMVFESYIKSKSHWRRFTAYFAGNGYFNPKQGTEARDKSHQLELPEWAKEVSYRIRKTGSMVKKNIDGDGQKRQTDGDEGKGQGVDKPVNNRPPKIYREVLDACGQSTYCQIQRGPGERIWKKIKIPYKCFIEYPGEYLKRLGYWVEMNFKEYLLFAALYDNELIADPSEPVFA